MRNSSYDRIMNLVGEDSAHVAVYDTILGRVLISSDGESVTGVSVIEEIPANLKLNPNAITDNAAAQLKEYFSGKRQTFDLPIKLKGTDFQCAAWNYLRTIPYGETRSYKQVAAEIGNPKASRAVGNANNKNPLMIIVPCHRVIGSKGDLVGFAGGVKIKKQLLELEQR